MTSKKGWMKQRAVWAAAAVAMLLAARSAWADPNPGNDSGNFTVRIQPNVDLGVTVDTTGSAWQGSTNLDVTMDLGTEKLLGTGVKVTVVGNFQNQEFQLQGTKLDTWTLDTDDTPNEDSLRLYGMFGIDPGASPASGDFVDLTNLITASAKRAGQAETGEVANLNHTYELSNLHAQYADVDGKSAANPGGMTVTGARRLWLRANTPQSTTSDEQQKFTVTVTAVNGVGL